MKEALLADALASTVSTHAAGHLRRARVLRTEPMSEGQLKTRLAALGIGHVDALVQFEQRAGVGQFPGGRCLGVSAFVDLVSDLPQLDGSPVFPIMGLPEHVPSWESAFAMLGADGSVSFYDAPEGPVRALDSWPALVELEALTPLGVDVYELRIDAHVGKLVADLVDALPHAPASGVRVSSFVGTEMVIKEFRTDFPAWTGLSGTFVAAEQLAPLADLAILLSEQGYALGYRGPLAPPPRDAEELLAFIDHAPRVGYAARAEVRIWRKVGMLGVTSKLVGLRNED